MYLEARSPSCFSARYVLKWDGRPHGEFRGRWFSETIDVRLTGRRRLTFSCPGFWGGKFELADGHTGEVLAGGERDGWLSSSWTLLLRTGSARLASAGIFNTGFVLESMGVERARVDRIGCCEGGWRVDGDAVMTDVDLVFVGLIYHTIIERRRRSRAAAAT